MIDKWLEALIYVIIGGSLLLAVSNTILNLDMYIPGFNYVVLFSLIFGLVIVSRKIASGE